MSDQAGTESGPAIADRQRWMSVLAKASGARLEDAWSALAEPPGFDHLRKPEAGMVMVRGRAGGTGERFNLGEMTVTRCVVRLADGAVGHAYVPGRDDRRAELAAVFDAMLQDPIRRPALERDLIAPVAADLAANRLAAGRKAAATKVEFFTLVRGEG